MEIELNKIEYEDFNLTSVQLDDKYNPDGDGEHPVFTRWDWCQIVAQRSTLLGYWDWVVYRLDDVYAGWCLATSVPQVPSPRPQEAQ